MTAKIAKIAKIAKTAKILPFMLFVCAFFVVLTGKTVMAEEPQPKRIAVYQSGEFWEFTEAEKRLKARLQQEELNKLLVFPDELRFSPGALAPEETQQETARQLMADPSISLIVSLGTRASRYLLEANNGHTPVVCLQITNPVASGLVDETTNNAVALNFFVPYEPNVFVEMFRIFHAAIPFKKMGFMYHASPESMASTHMLDAREVARERGFELVEYVGLDAEQSPQSCEKGLQSLLDEGIDAFYVAPLNCLNLGTTSQQQLYAKLHSRGIRTFASSHNFSHEVQAGVLMGFIVQNIDDLGALVIEHIATTLDLPQQNTTESAKRKLSRIVLNLDTALRSNVPISLVLLVTADTIYETSFPPLLPLQKLYFNKPSTEIKTDAP